MRGKWTYINSESLHQTLAFDELSGWLFCKDGTRYSPAELAKITDGFRGEVELPRAVHLVKKVFAGEIVEKKRKGWKPYAHPGKDN